MKQTAIAIAALFGLGIACAKGGSHMTSGYVKKDGSYVAPHMQTDPNASFGQTLTLLASFKIALPRRLLR